MVPFDVCQTPLVKVNTLIQFLRPPRLHSSNQPIFSDHSGLGGCEMIVKDSLIPCVSVNLCLSLVFCKVHETLQESPTVHTGAIRSPLGN